MCKNNENNNLKHLCFEDYFQDDWRKYFQEKETVQNILEAAGLSSSHDFVQINSRYLIDDNRVAVIALIKRKNTEVLDKLIIDIIAGNSSFEQVYDVAYSTGAGCDYRLIICDWNSKNKSPGLWMTDDIMCQLICHFDRHLSLYWICADAIRDIDWTMRIVYTVIESVSKSEGFSEMPDRRDLEHAELMFYVTQASEYFSSEDDHPLNFSNYYEDENSWAEWKDEALISELNMDQDDYTWLITNRADELKSNNCSYEYDEESQTLTITEAVPFQNFRYSLPDDKSDWADNFYRSARIGTWIDELLCEKETEENPLATMTTGSINMPSPAIVSDVENENDKESHDDEEIIYPDVLEFLGPNWKEYFLNPETMKSIIKAVNDQNKFKARYRKSQKRGISYLTNNEMTYDFVEVDSIKQIGSDRERIIATMMDIERGLFEKWSIDISSKAPQLDQMFYALYDVDDDCAQKVILYFNNIRDRKKPDVEVEVENKVAENILYKISSYSDKIYPVHVTITDSSEEGRDYEIFIVNGYCSSQHGKIPSRSVFESAIWESYYGSFICCFVSLNKERYISTLVADVDYPYSKISFLVGPEWTDKGLFMRLYAKHECPETNWLLKFKMDELARRYCGNDLQRVIKPSTHYSIVIHLHELPVSDFIESTTLAKFNYASDVRKQQLDMIRHIEEIFQDYVPEIKLI